MMELEIALGHRQQNGMEEQDRVSQASSVVTVSSTRDKADKKLQSFCKRSRSVQRDPNCAVVIRGWLYKRDSTGLKLWKRRWFVLSNYCLFYYKDSREESVLGSLPLPSYKIFFCSPGECKNRKYAFKVVHQGMRSYLLSADTQEDMLGWVRALRHSACMETDDLINRRCSSYHDFSQIGGSTESVTPLHIYKTQNKHSHAAGSVDLGDHRSRHRPLHSYDIQTQSQSLDHTGVDHFQWHGSGPSTPRCHYGSRSHSPMGRVDLRPQCEKETHTLSALQGGTDMVLTCLCGCDKVLQTLSVEMDLLQNDKDHAEFALNMSRIELGKRQLNDQHISQKALLQEELVTIRARMCDITQEMEGVWLDYKRMESELCVFRSHLQHICHFGLPQERPLAQKQIWMMDDILSGLKPNRRRFNALIVSHTPKKESVHYWGEESEPPARPPLPLELENTNKSTKLRSEWVEPNYTKLYNTDTIKTESRAVCLGEESNHFRQMAQRFHQKEMHNKRSQSPDYRMNKPRSFIESESESSPFCLMYVTRSKLPSALTAQSVCVEDSNPEEDKINTLSYKHGERSDNDNVDVCDLNRESDLFVKSEQRHNKLKRVEHVKERVPKSVLRRSDSAHPLKFIDIEGSVNRCQMSTQSVSTDRVHIHGDMWMSESDVPETPPTFSDIKPSSTNHISTLTINNIASEDTDQSVNCSTSTNQRAEWFLSTNHWQEFIPLNIQEEELSPTNQDSDTSTNQDSDTSTNQDSEQSTNQTHLRGKSNMTTSLITMDTLNKNTPKSSGIVFHQATGTSSDSHMVSRSDHSGRELCIDEEIQYKPAQSATDNNGGIVDGAKAQRSNLSINPNENGAPTEKAVKETGSDVTIGGKTTEVVYGCWSKNSETNHNDSFHKPRVTVVSTSL
ncbi:pleckstrin homology domain-containing family A member 5 [Tachysurus fulvidraco]|uniref:pleckstrin homology domain-containing family A member 5 n=1 Tax=Tachysurus fulvidraco TaxID=1234273 RepID=UPI001FEFB3DB|nr:pleckstrin homology domain-containing family A member 5 [Tachysurus fulvidraco]